MRVTDQQVLGAQATFWDELRHWRILPFRAPGLGRTEYKAVRDQQIGEEEPRYMDQDTEDAARSYMQFQALKAALESVQLEECPTDD